MEQKHKKKHSLLKPLSIGFLATALLLTQPSATPMPENYNRYEKSIEIMRDELKDFSDTYTQFKQDRLNQVFLEEMLEKTNTLEQITEKTSGIFDSYVLDYLRKENIIPNKNFEVAGKNIKEKILRESTLDNIISDYFGKEITNTYSISQEKFQVQRINNSDDYGIKAIDAINDFYSTGLLKEKQIKFLGEGYNFFKDQIEDSWLNRSMANRDIQTRINLIKEYISAEQKSETQDLDFFEWTELNILKNLKFDSNPEKNQEEALRVLLNGFEPIEISEKQEERMSKAMNEYDFQKIYDSSGVSDKYLMHGQVMQESGFNKNARSHKNAKGFFQFMPGTAKMMRINRDNPEQNIFGGSKYNQMMWNYLAGYPESIKRLVIPGGHNSGHYNIYNILEAKRIPNETKKHIKQVNSYRKTLMQQNVLEMAYQSPAFTSKSIYVP